MSPSSEKLIGPNYLDWIYTLRITLGYEGKQYILDDDFPLLDDDSSKEELVSYNKYYDESTKFNCLMLATMSYELQKGFKSLVRMT